MPKLIDAEKLAEYKASGISELTEWQQGWNDAIDTIMNETPTVDAESAKRGRWIKVEDDYNNHLYECSYCHTWTSLPTEEDKDPHIRYCWSCGAKMDEVKE